MTDRKETPNRTGKKTSDVQQPGPLSGKWLPQDERDALATMVAQLRDEYQPSTATQNITIERMAMAMTKLRRLHDIENAMHAAARVHAKRMQDRGRDDYEGISSELAEASAVPFLNVWSVLGKYQASLDRQISTAIGELRALKGTLASPLKKALASSTTEAQHR